MRTGTIATLAAVGGAAVGVIGKSVFVDADGGGVVAAYVARYDQLKRNNIPVIVRGSCASSCTIGLGYDNVCLGPKAMMGFHPGYDPIFFGWFGYVLDPVATALMVKHYPPDAKAVLEKHHIDLNKNPGAARDGLRWYPKVTYIKGSEFPAHYQCKEDRTVEAPA